jgi:hypothetical protein
MGRREDIAARIACRTVESPAPGHLSSDLGPCKLWTGPTSGDSGRGKGYPRMWLDGQTVAVHLVVWTNIHGFIPGKKQIDHLCRNRLCVAERHLEMVTHKVNQKRRAAAAKENQPHDEETLYHAVLPDGRA